MNTGNTPPTQPSYEVPPGPGSYQVPPPPGNYSVPPSGYSHTPMPVRDSWGSAQKDKWVATLLAAVLGPLGIHKFYLGYKKEGQIMLLVTLAGSIFTLGFAAAAMGIVSIIEAVNYVILTQEDFERIYVYGYKAWF